MNEFLEEARWVAIRQAEAGDITASNTIMQLIDLVKQENTKVTNQSTVIDGLLAAVTDFKKTLSD